MVIYLLSTPFVIQLIRPHSNNTGFQQYINIIFNNSVIKPVDYNNVPIFYPIILIIKTHFKNVSTKYSFIRINKF